MKTLDSVYRGFALRIAVGIIFVILLASYAGIAVVGNKSSSFGGESPGLIVITSVTTTSLTADITISGFSFQPQTINVTGGTTVTWTNLDAVAHTVTSDTGLFDSGLISPGQTFSRTFNEAGTFDYHCSIHTFMTGKVIVSPVSTGAPALVSSITPNSRNAQLGIPVTLFMSVINYGTATATGVSIKQASNLPATVSYQQWDGTAFTGSANTPVDMAAGSTANFVITINATSAFDSSSLTFNASGTNVAAAPISAVNTLTMSASATPSADVIMMSTSLDVSTAVNTPAVFAVATSNVGGASATGASLILDIPSSITGLVYQLNETYPVNGTIKGPATGLTIGIGAQPTFAVFLIPTQPIAYDPTNNRITIKLADGSGKVIGAQSVALSTT